VVNSEELIATTEYLTLYTECRINRCRYNRVRLYIDINVIRYKKSITYTSYWLLQFD
jgi:hypothetical protein